MSEPTMLDVLRGSSCIAVYVLLLSVPARADAPAGRYMAGTGTVLDTKTGLTWEQPASTTPLVWSAAKSYCTAKGTGWRLPTIKELVSIVDFGKTTSPKIDSIFTGMVSGDWSSTPVAGASDTFYGVNFVNGGIDIGAGPAVTSPVRCVR